MNLNKNHTAYSKPFDFCFVFLILKHRTSGYVQPIPANSDHLA